MSLSDGGEAGIEVLRTHSLPEIEADAVRAVEVPFTSPDSGIIQIGGVTDLHAVRLSPGSYLLRYEIKYAPDGEEGDYDLMACRLIFACGETPRFQIARADKYLQPPPSLVLTCDPI